MYDVGERREEYNSKCVGAERVLYAKFEVNGIEYDDNYINKISVSHSIDGNSYKIGCTPSAVLRLELNNFEEKLTGANFENKEIAIRIGVEMGEEDFIEVLQGVFIVTEVKKSRDKIDITGFDRMLLLDRKADITIEKPYSINDLLEMIAIMGNVELDEEMSLDFGSVVIDKDIEYGKWTYRQIVGYIAEMNGGNAFFTKDGKLKISKSGYTEDISLSADAWFTLSAAEEDFNGYDSLMIKNENEVIYDDTSADDDFIYYITDNPFTVYMDNIEMAELSEQLHNVGYRGFEMDWRGIPSSEINDTAVITDGGTYKAVFLNVDWTYSGGFRMSCSAPQPNKTKEEASEAKPSISGQISETNNRVESLIKGENKEFNQTIAHEVLSAEMIEAGSAFIEDLFVEMFETNLKGIKCVPNIIKNEEGGYEWTGGEKGYIIPNVSGNIRAYIKAEGISLKFIEAHLTENSVKPLMINGKQVYYTSIADGENAYEYFTFANPKEKYPEMTDENAEMFKVMIRASENEYTKAEFKFKSNGSTFEPMLMFGVGINNYDDRGKFIFEKSNEYGIFYYLAENGVDKIGVRVSENGVEYYDAEDSTWKNVGGGGKEYYVGKEELTQEEINGLTEGQAVFIYDAENIYTAE